MLFFNLSHQGIIRVSWVGLLVYIDLVYTSILLFVHDLSTIYRPVLFLVLIFEVNGLSQKISKAYDPCLPGKVNCY